MDRKTVLVIDDEAHVRMLYAEELRAYRAWNFGVGVMDWAEADPALAIVQDRLRAWRIGDVFGVSVRPMACGVELVEDGR